MRKIILILFCFAMLISCAKESESIDLHSYVTDKTWKAIDDRQKEYYLSSDGEKRYMWIERGAEKSDATGTPETNPLSNEPGWHELGIFLIKNDTLFTQSNNDDRIFGTHIKPGNDTIIESVNYQTLRFYVIPDQYRTWISKK